MGVWQGVVGVPGSGGTAAVRKIAAASLPQNRVLLALPAGAVETAVSDGHRVLAAGASRPIGDFIPSRYLKARPRAGS